MKTLEQFNSRYVKMWSDFDSREIPWQGYFLFDTLLGAALSPKLRSLVRDIPFVV